MKKKPIVAGNWKMNKLPSEGSSFISEISKLVKDIKAVEVIYAPPFTGLFDLKVKPPFHIAAQNCHWEDCGAFTGEISLQMIKDCGAEYVILGHPSDVISSMKPMNGLIIKLGQFSRMI